MDFNRDGDPVRGAAGAWPWEREVRTVLLARRGVLSWFEGHDSRQGGGTPAGAVYRQSLLVAGYRGTWRVAAGLLCGKVGNNPLAVRQLGCEIRADRIC